MYKDKTIGVVIPAYNEEKLIEQTLTTLPDFVDNIIVVDDYSQDRTINIVKEMSHKNAKIFLSIHQKNQGVGGAISTGYKEALNKKIDVVVVVAGDAQMNPRDMINIIKPVVDEEADYVKGNRLFRGESWKMIPHYRYLGNSFLSLLTKIASGYWHIADSQCGYTAISQKALRVIDIGSIYKRYGMPNDLLIKLNIYSLKVKDVSVMPVYNQGEKSGIKLWKVVPTISWLLLSGFLKRLWQKYVIRDFHPLVFFYIFAFFLLLLNLPLFVRLIYVWIVDGAVPRTTALALMFATIIGFQSLFFAMWFDMEYNKELK